MRLEFIRTLGSQPLSLFRPVGGLLCDMRPLALLLLCTGLMACHGVIPAGTPLVADDPFVTESLRLASAARTGSISIGDVACASLNKLPRLWRLDEVVDQALCHNPQTREVWFGARAQAAQVGVRRAAYLPSLEGIVTFTHSGIAANGADTFVDSGLDTALVFDYLLFDFGGRAGSLESAVQDLWKTHWIHNAVLQNVTLAAVQGYYQLITARAAVEAAEASEKSSLESLQAARFRHRIGAASLADKLQAQTAYSQAKLGRERAAGDARIAQGALATLLGLAADYPLRLTPPRVQAPIEHREQDLRRLFASAQKARPDLQAAEAGVRAAQARVEVARASGLPKLSLVGSYGYDYADKLGNISTYSVGLSLRLPLFTGFDTTYRVRAAEEIVNVQAARRDTLRNQVAFDVWQAYQDLNTARENLGSSADLLASATQSEEVARGRYRAGAGSMLDLVQSQSSLANARLQRIGAQYSWFVAKATLAQALGQLDLSALRNGGLRATG